MTKKGRIVCAPFFVAGLEHYSERDWDEMEYSAFRWLAGYEVISRFQEAGDRTHGECHPYSGIQTPMIFGLRGGDIELRVVQTSSSHDVALRRSSGKRVDEIGEYSSDSEAVCGGWGGSNGLAREAIVDPVQSDPDW